MAVQNQLCAFGGKPARDRRADAAGSAGDQDYFAAQIRFHAQIFTGIGLRTPFNLKLGTSVLLTLKIGFPKFVFGGIDGRQRRA